MEKPTIGNTAAVFQAGDTISTYLAQAIRFIDDKLGEGYAAKNPALIAACVAAQTSDFNNTSLVAVLYEIREAFGSLSVHLEADDYLPVSLYGTPHGGPVEVVMAERNPLNSKKPKSF